MGTKQGLMQAATCFEVNKKTCDINRLLMSSITTWAIAIYRLCVSGQSAYPTCYRWTSEHGFLCFCIACNSKTWQKGMHASIHILGSVFPRELNFNPCDIECLYIN
jgi:hypothetical protein